MVKDSSKSHGEEKIESKIEEMIEQDLSDYLVKAENIGRVKRIEDAKGMTGKGADGS